ncbi:MAG: radical SAM protein [Candidatus Cloacimonetes bacterium]|nr:radical SAM protein [Candidatus Cloacimonadota bacterium]
MNNALLIVQESSDSQKIFFQQIARALDLEVCKFKDKKGNIPLEKDAYIIASWGVSLQELEEVALSIKSIIQDAPLFWLNEYTQDEEVREQTGLSVCDGFIVSYDMFDTIQQMSKIEDMFDLTKIHGLIINQKSNLNYSPKKPKRRDFSPEVFTIPKGVDLDHEGYFSFVTAQGCSRRCHHCAILSKEGFRKRAKVDDLIKYLQDLNEQKGYRKFHLVDQTINDSKEYFQSFLEKVIELKLGYSFKLSMTFEEMGENLFNLMVEAGVKTVTLPLFSGSDRVNYHNNISDRMTVIKKNLTRFSQCGIKVHLKSYVGLPHEEYGDFFQTLQFLESHSRYIDQITSIEPAILEPNSFFYRRHSENKIAISPGVYNSFVREESDHLNDYGARLEKAHFLQKKMKSLGLYQKDISSNYSDENINQKYAEFKKSKVDIALVTCPPWGYLNPPAGIAKLSSYLRSKDKIAQVFDFNVKFYSVYEELQRLWHVENKSYWSNDITFDVILHLYEDDIEEAVESILKSNTKLIGFSAVDPKERMTIEFIRRLRERDSELTIILGGPVCGTTEYRNIFRDKLGQHGVNLYAIGEGEETLMDILRNYEQQKPLEGILGTCHLDKDLNWVFAEKRQFINLLDMPITTFEEFDLSDYNCQELIIEWSRGCIGTCAFCKAKVLDGMFRNYSPEHIVESLRYYSEVLKIQDYTICDLAFNGNWKMLEKVADLLIEANLDIRLKAQGIPRRQMKLPLLQKFKKAGFVEIQWGIESGSDKVLKAMDKSWMFTIEEAQEVVRNCHLAEIRTYMFCIVGFPTEEEEDFQMTYDFIDRNSEYLDMVKSVNGLHIITDTPVHHKAEEFGLVLPEENYHYLWSMPGNTHEIRQDRTKRLLELIKVKGLACIETNLLEGRQFELLKDYKEKYIPMDERVDFLVRDINTLIDYRMNAQEEWTQSIDVRGEFLQNNRDLIGVFHGKKSLTTPDIVEIDLSNNCNFKCVGCWCHCDHLKELKTPAQLRKKRLPLDTLQRLIKDLAESGTKIIQLAGPGEPFTHPDIMDIIRYIKGNGLELHIITNFSYITFEIAQELMDLKVDQITASVWAGSDEVFEKTHPDTKKSTFHKIKEAMTFIGNNKKYNQYPRIKIYNVINKYNCNDIEAMVDFGLEVRADTMEFTAVDTVEGKTDFLSLSLEDVLSIEEQFKRVSERATYPDPPGWKHLKNLTKEQREEHYELHAKFFTDLGDYQGFEYEEVNKVMTCKAGLSNERMDHDPQDVCANIFYFPQSACTSCKLQPECEIDPKTFSVKTRFFSVLGYGTFIRRAKLSAMERERKQELIGQQEAELKQSSTKRDARALDLLPKTPMVDSIPCTIGWTYSRITTDGDVIGCCKGYNKTLGNLYENNFLYIWNDHPMQEFRYKGKNFNKSDSYFDEIGCYKACDNVGHNMNIYRRIKALKPRERKWLEEEAKLIRP